MKARRRPSDAYYIRNTYQQVFAKGVGPVFRAQAGASPTTIYYISSNGGGTFVPKSYFYGFSRRETPD